MRVAALSGAGLPYEGRRGAFWAVLGPDVELGRSTCDVDGTVRSIRELGPMSEELLGDLVSPLDAETATAELEELRGA